MFKKFTTILFICLLSSCSNNYINNNQQDPTTINQTTSSDIEEQKLDLPLHIFGEKSIEKHGIHHFYIIQKTKNSLSTYQTHFISSNDSSSLDENGNSKPNDSYLSFTNHEYGVIDVQTIFDAQLQKMNLKILTIDGRYKTVNFFIDGKENQLSLPETFF